MMRHVSLEKLRLGWQAAMLDVLTALVCFVGAYRLRFGAADFFQFVSIALGAFPIIAVVHVALLALVRLYRIRGQILWPLRLMAATVIGVPLGTLAAMALVGVEGISRQAIAGYGFMFIVAALGWRAAVGLHTRWLAMRHPPETEGELEVLGAHYRSITGGLVLAFQYRDLLRNLVAKDLKLKYRGSALGFAWSLLNPVAMIVVYTVAFTYVLGIRTERYPFFVLLGLLAWTFFAASIMGSTDAIATSGGLLRSVLFPRVLLPISGVLFNLVQYLLTIAVLLPLMLAYHRIAFGPQMLMFPVFLLLQVLFVTGLSLIFSTTTVFFRDVKHLVEVAVSIVFWSTPIIYEYTLVPEQYRQLLLLSPMAPFIRAYQDLFYYLTWPDVSVWLVAIAYAVGAFVSGVSVFVVYEDRFSERV